MLVTVVATLAKDAPNAADVETLIYRVALPGIVPTLGVVVS